MALPPPLYDLVLLLDSQAEDDRRAQILRGVEDAIGKGGEIVNKQDWGLRATAFEIRHKGEAQYHLVQFHADRAALEELNRMLRIADGVVRYRIIKLKPGTAPSSPGAAAQDAAEASAAEPAEAL